MKGWWIGIGVLAALLWMGRRMNRSDGSPERSRGSGAPPSDAEIDAMIMARRKIDAIKAYRVAHGGDLKDAKDAIDARERDLPRAPS